MQYVQCFIRYDRHLPLTQAVGIRTDGSIGQFLAHPIQIFEKNKKNSFFNLKF